MTELEQTFNVERFYAALDSERQLRNLNWKELAEQASVHAQGQPSLNFQFLTSSLSLQPFFNFPTVLTRSQHLHVNQLLAVYLFEKII